MAGTSRLFYVSVGVHHGSALSKFNFVLAISCGTFNVQGSMQMVFSKRLITKFISGSLSKCGMISQNLTKTEFLTTNANETPSLSVEAICQEEIDLSVTDQCYKPTADCAIG